MYTWVNFVVCASIFMYLRWWVNSTYNGSGLLLFFLGFLGVWEFLFLVCVVFSLLCYTLRLVSNY